MDETAKRKELMEHKELIERKKLIELYLNRRDRFRNNNKAMDELHHWQLRDEDYDYTVLYVSFPLTSPRESQTAYYYPTAQDADQYNVRRNGLIPSRIVDNPSDFKQRFVKCDTWFSEFLKHNPKDLILSTSKHSYIIGNLASYDKRQYPAWFLHPDDPTKAIHIPSSPASPDPNSLFSPSDERKRSADAALSPEQATSVSESRGSGSDNTMTDRRNDEKHEITPEGQAFGHCLVIPKNRIFNIVDPLAVKDHCAVIRELRHHFIEFWNGKNGPQILLTRTRRGFDEQNEKLRARLNSIPVPSSSSPSMTRQKTRDFAAKREAQLDSLMLDLEAGYENMAAQFKELRAPEDFVFGFHPFPDNSVGHLHLHVYPRKPELREWSSKEHEWKTVEFDMVLEAEGETWEGDRGR